MIVGNVMSRQPRSVQVARHFSAAVVVVVVEAAAATRVFFSSNSVHRTRTLSSNQLASYVGNGTH